MITLSRDLRIALALLVAASVLFILYSFDPLQSTFYPICVFKKFTGYDCPGCGSARSLHALLNGNILMAADYNLLLLILLPVIIAGLLNFLNKNDNKLWTLVNKPVFFLVIICIYWIMRNIDLYPFTYLNSGR